MNNEDRYEILYHPSYLINDELQLALKNEKWDVNLSQKDDLFYLIVFRVFNREENSVIYSSISYNKLFFVPLLQYIKTKNCGLFAYEEPGNFLTLIDYSLRDPLHGHRLMRNEFSQLILENLPLLVKNDDPVLLSMLNIVNRMVLLSDYDDMSCILKLAVKRIYVDFIHMILHEAPSYKYFAKYYRDLDSSQHSLVHNCLFIVKDKDKFIKKLRESEEFKGLNGGPKKFRDEINLCHYFLINIDTRFRDYLSRHNEYHASSYKNHYTERLDKKKFSYNNIHTNLSKTKRYSTKKNVNHKEISKDITLKNTLKENKL